MNSYSSAEIQAILLNSLITNGTVDSALDNRPRTENIMHNFHLEDCLYVPDEALKQRLNEYKQWCSDRTGEDPGKLMEEICYLSFRCLSGWESIKSFQSYAPQHDLVISGSTPHWLYLMVYLHLPVEGRTIVAEAKNLEKPVNEAQFSRLCSIIQNKFSRLSHLGVFFTRRGATGFNKHRCLRDAKATQVLFYASTNKFVVVLNDSDILELDKAGALPRILERKIRDVAEGAGISHEISEEWREVMLPDHLSKYQIN